MTYNAPKPFFDTLRTAFGPLTESQVAGSNTIIAEGIRRKTPLHKLTYVLATSYWETGKTMAPVEEGYYLGAKAKAFQQKLRYFPYYGRGHVQLTWEANYRKAGDALGVDLVKNPGLALDPKISIRILFEGMERGWFTGKDLGDYIDNVDESDDEDLREFANARRIVNGTDKQIEIGKIALVFEKALRAIRYDGVAPMPEAQPEPAPKPEKKSALVIGLLIAFFVTLIIIIAAFVGAS